MFNIMALHQQNLHMDTHTNKKKAKAHTHSQGKVVQTIQYMTLTQPNFIILKNL